MDALTLATARQADEVGALLIEDLGTGALAALAGAAITLRAQRRMGIQPSTRTAILIGADVSTMLRGATPPRAAEQAQRAGLRKSTYLRLRRVAHRILSRHIAAAAAGTRNCRDLAD